MMAWRQDINSHNVYQHDSLTGFWGKPNVQRRIVYENMGGITTEVVHNEFGIREAAIDTASSQKNFVCFGGSHTWGAYVQQNERYNDVLSSLTRRRFINAGHPSFGLDQICLTILNRSLQLNPEGIVIEQYPWAFHRVLNSYVNGYLKPYYYISREGELECSPVPRLARFKAYRKIVGEYRLYKKEFMEARNGIDIKEEYDPSRDPVFLLWKMPYYEYAYELFGRIARKIKDFCDDNNIKLLIFLTAHLQHFYPESGTELVDYDLPTKKLKATLDRCEVPYVNFAPQLIVEHKAGRPVIFSDGHLNHNGHAKVAELLSVELEKRGWF